MKIARVLLLIAFACWPSLVVGLPASSEMSAKWQEMIGKIEALQADPLRADAKEQGASIVTWLINSKEVSFTVCAVLTVSLTDKGDSVGGLLAVHSLLGAAKYAMTVPLENQSKMQTYVASMNGALDAYEKAVAADEKYRRKRVDEVLELRSDGKIDEYVRKHSKKCGH